jgi:TatA/E family protein of Tat protein translocase
VKFLMQPWVLIVILLVVFILFAPKRLPDASKSMRKGMRAFKDDAAPEDATSDDAAKPADSRTDEKDGPAQS